MKHLLVFGLLLTLLNANALSHAEGDDNRTPERKADEGNLGAHSDAPWEERLKEFLDKNKEAALFKVTDKQKEQLRDLLKEAKPEV